MSLQSMFNSMIGNVGVQSSVLKNRLRPAEEEPDELKKQKLEATTKTAEAKRDAAIAKQLTAESKQRVQEAKEKAYTEKAQKKAQKGDAKEKTVNNTSEPEKRQETPLETATAQKNKGGRPRKEISLQRVAERVETLQNQRESIAARAGLIKSRLGMEEKA